VTNLAPLLESLDAFYLEHRLCDALDGDLEEDCGDGVATVWLACSCGASVAREVG
jgi:hypothetical protein